MISKNLKKDVNMCLLSAFLLGVIVTFFVVFHCPVIQDSRDSIRKQGLFLVQLYKVFGSKGIKKFHELSGERR